MNVAEYISIDPTIRFGKPCIKGTRITIGDILDCLASDMSFEEIVEEYPALNDQSIKAALLFASNRESISKIIAA